MTEKEMILMSSLVLTCDASLAYSMGLVGVLKETGAATPATLETQLATLEKLRAQTTRIASECGVDLNYFRSLGKV
jgi:hypothetical protein